MSTDAKSHCPECGALASGGKDGCQKLFEEILAKEFSDFRYSRLHRHTVDAYSLQHPARYMRSGKSFAAHLTGMYAAFDAPDAAAVNRSVQGWLDGPKSLHRPDPPPPGHRGTLTVLHLHQATDAEDHLSRVREWARSVWLAWSDHHQLARDWVEQADRESAKR